MKKLLFLAALFCTMFANVANAQAYLSDGAMIQIGDKYMEENFLRAGDIPELTQGTMSYDPVGHVLTMTNVEIVTPSDAESVSGVAFVCSNMPEGSQQIEIRLVGDNIIRAEKKGVWASLTLGDGKYVITGLNGSLKLMTDEGNGLLLMCESLTIKDGAFVYAGYSETGMQTKYGVWHFADPVPELNIDCATLWAFGTDGCMEGLQPSLNDAELEGEYVFDENKWKWYESDGKTILKNKILIFKPTKNIFWWINSNPEGGSVTVTKDGNPISNPYRYGEDESNSWVDIVATPNDGWEFAGWKTFTGAVETSDPSTKYGLPETKYAKTGMLVAYFRQTEPAEPTKPWYILDNLADRVLVFSTLAASPEEVLNPIPDKTEVTQSVFAEGRLYYMDQTASDKVDFYSCKFDPAAGTMDDKQKVLSINTYKKFFALTYNIDERYFYAVARKNDEKQYLVKIELNGYSIKEVGEIKGADANNSTGIYLMAANRQGELYGILKAGETHNKEASPFRHGSMFCKISKETAAVTPVGWTGFYFESLSCAMAFDYKTGALIANSSSIAMPCLLSIDVTTGRGTRLQEYTGYCNGIFQMVPETRPVTVGVKSGDEDKGTAAIKGTGKTTGSYMIGDEFEIEASPKTKEYRFVKWNDGNTDTPRTVTMGEDAATYTAEFDWAEDLTVYPVIAGGVQMNTYKTVLNSGNCPSISTGSISFDPQTGTLTLNKLSLDDASSEYALEIGDKENRMEINMVLEGDNHINAYNTAVVRLNNLKMNITGNTLTINTYYTATGIYLDKTDLTLYAVKNVEINANGYGFYSNEHSTLTFLGTNCDLTGLGSAIEGGWDAVELKHCSIKSPADAKFNEEKGRLEDSNGDAIKSKVVIAADPEVRGTAMEEGTGEVVISSGDTEFSSVGWFEVGTEITITAQPADGYVFARWMDDDNWTDEEKRKPAVRTFKTTGTEKPYSALFYYAPKSSASWYATNGGKFVKFSMSDNAAEVERASAPAATNVKTGEYALNSWFYIDNTDVKQLTFEGLTDGKPIDDSGIETLFTGVTGINDIAFNFTGSVMYATATDKLYVVDTEKKQLTELGSYECDGKAVSGIVGMAVNAAGKIYLLGSGDPSGILYTVSDIDTDNTKVTLALVGETGQLGVAVPAAAQSIAFDHVTGELFWGEAKYMRILSTEDAKAHICGDLGQTGGNQGALKAMHRMDCMATVKVKVADGCNDMGSVSVNKSKVFVGNKVTITAKANSGYKFLYWKRGESEIKSDSYTFSPTNNVTYTAYFEKTAGLEEVSADAAGGVQKLLIGGTLYILRDGHIYTPAGQLVK